MSKKRRSAPVDDNPKWNADDFARARPASEMLAGDIANALVRKTGRPALPPEKRKQPVSMRLDPDLLEAMRDTGPGWQARAEEVLRREYLPNPDGNAQEGRRYGVAASRAGEMTVNLANLVFTGRFSEAEDVFTKVTPSEDSAHAPLGDFGDSVAEAWESYRLMHGPRVTIRDVSTDIPGSMTAHIAEVTEGVQKALDAASILVGGDKAPAPAKSRRGKRLKKDGPVTPPSPRR